MTRNRPYHHGALRSALLAEALRSLEAEGLESLSLRGLAQAVGVSKTAPYRHFADKRALLVDLAAEGFRMFANVLEGALAEPVTGSGPDSPHGPVSRLTAAYLVFARGRPALYRLMFSRLGYSLHSEECRLNAERAFGCLGRAVAEAQQSGWRPAQDARSLALSVWAQAHGWAGLITDGLITDDMQAGESDPESIADALL